MKYWFEYHVEHKITFDNYFKSFPTEKETCFSNNNNWSTLLTQSNDKLNQFEQKINL